MCCSRPLQWEFHLHFGVSPLVRGLKGIFDLVLVWSLRYTGAGYVVVWAVKGWVWCFLGWGKAVAEYDAVRTG